MNSQNYLIDTNVFIGLEDDRQVSADVANFLALANKHGVGVFVHEAAKEDIARDTNPQRRAISLSKIAKFQILKKVRGLTESDLQAAYGTLNKSNDVVDATLLQALDSGAIDFLITEDRGLHARARQHAAHLSRRVLFIADATSLLVSTFEPIMVPLRFVEEVAANEIPLTDGIFDSLREGYEGFDEWWRTKCVALHRRCWAVYDEELAGLIVRKDETSADTEATLPGEKILKICTFKVRPEKRGTKLGELLLKQALWFAQSNGYDVVYLTTKAEQQALIDLLEYYGFQHTQTLGGVELVFEKTLSREPVDADGVSDFYELARRNYPRFYTGVPAYIVPIKEAYHDTLFPELKDDAQGDLLSLIGGGGGPRRPGNTIRKVYLCQAQANLGSPGSLLFFYKGVSGLEPSQAITTVGIFEDMQLAHSTTDLMRLTGGRSVYSEEALNEWNAAPDRPVKVINFLLAAYITPPLGIAGLKQSGIFKKNPPQSIAQIQRPHLGTILAELDIGFRT
jgi:ribosomal protein S18 acetylase RimI-like enzyme